MASFVDLLHKVTDLLESEGSLSYRAIKREFDIDDDVIEDIKTELVEVKRIARDIDGKVLESTRAGRRVAARQTAKSAGETRYKPKPVKRTFLIWLGAACILVGVLLPWVSSQIQMEGIGTQSSRVNGLDLNQGLISIAVSVFSAVLGFAAARTTIPAKVVALAIIITGIVVVGITLDVIDGISNSDLGLPGFGGRPVLSVRQNPQAGVFVTLAGGSLLSLGGLIALIRTRKRKG
jgi:hypothetical protein